MTNFDLPRNLVGMITHCSITELSFNFQLDDFSIAEKSNIFSYTASSIFDSLMNKFESVADQLILFDSFFTRIFNEKLKVQYLFDLLLGELMVSGINKPTSRRMVLKTIQEPSMLSLIYIKSKQAIVLNLDANEEHLKSATLDQNLQRIFEKLGVDVFNSIFLEADMTKTSKSEKLVDLTGFKYFKHAGKISTKLNDMLSPDYLAFIPLRPIKTKSLPKKPKNQPLDMYVYKLNAFDFLKKIEQDFLGVKITKALKDAQEVLGEILTTDVSKIKHFLYSLLVPFFDVQAFIDDPASYLILTDLEQINWKFAAVAVTIRKGNKIQKQLIDSEVGSVKKILKIKHNLRVEQFPMFLTILKENRDKSIDIRESICYV